MKQCSQACTHRSMAKNNQIMLPGMHAVTWKHIILLPGMHVVTWQHIYNAAC